MTTPAMTGKDRAMPNNSDQAAMLPCPFCGGEARVSGPTAQRTDPKEKGGRFFPVVNCRSCFAEAWGVDFDESGSTAIQKWNRRAPATDQSAMHDELRARLLDVQSQAGKAATQSAYTAAGEKAIRMIPELIAALTLPASEAVAFVEQTAPEGLYARFVGAGNMDTVGPGTKLFTTPQPSPAAHAGVEALPVEALREKLQELREEVSVQQSLMDHYQDWDDANRLFDQLTALLSGGAAREEE